MGYTVFHDGDYNEISPKIHFNSSATGGSGNSGSTVTPAPSISDIKIIESQSDPNNDGKIDSSDATMILIDYANYLLNGKSTLTNEQADSNGDGIIDSSDATNILIYYANKLLEG